MTRMDPRGGAFLLLIPVLVAAVSVGLLADATAQNAAPGDASGTYPGMGDVKAGTFKMGIDVKDLVKLYGDPKKPTRKTHQLLVGKDKDMWWDLLLQETPEHRAETEDYSIDIYPVTNAQYRRFLEDETKGSFFTRTKVNTIAKVAEQLYGGSPGEWKEEAIFWINEKKLEEQKAEIYKQNKAQIDAILANFNQGRPPQAQVTDFDKLPDKIRARGWVSFVLPADINLTIYRRGIPDNWDKGVLPKELETAPVIWITADDADAFAEWAGKHVPTEAEFERAARGPKDFLFPWGPTWDWQKQRNLLVWAEADPEPKGPAAPYKDRPVDVTRGKDGVSPYGLYHMLGNVREWTSSPPDLYPGSRAKKEKWFGSTDYRVIRSTSYGDGRISGESELTIRNTARALRSGSGPFTTKERYPAVGFRCAKYPRPTRDIMMLRQAALIRQGALNPRHDTVKLFGPARAYGVERRHYDETGGGNQTFVTARTRVIGAVPMEKSPYAQTKELIDASNETDPAKGGPQPFAWIYWNGDIKVEVVKEKIVEPEKPAEEGAPGGGDGEKKDGEEKPADEKGGEKKTAGRPAKPGRSSQTAEEEPAGPQIIRSREFVACDPDRPLFLGVVSGRLALLELKAMGPALVGYLPIQAAAGQTEGAEVVVKETPREIEKRGEKVRFAKIDPATGLVRFRFGILTRSKTSDDVFRIDVVLKVQGTIAGEWEGYEE